MQFPIIIGLHRSFFLESAVLATHALVAASLFAPGWPAPVLAFGWGATAASAFFAWRQASPKLAQLRLHGDGRVDGREAGDRDFEAAELLGQPYVHQWLTVFIIRIGGRRIPVAVLPDSMASEEFRRLRVWLRWVGGVRNAGGAA